MELIIIVGLLIIPAIVLKIVDAIAKIQDFDGLEYLDNDEDW
jgi:hypothetical protein